MNDSLEYTVTVTGPNGEILQTHSAPITDEYRKQAIREFFEDLARHRGAVAYFLLSRNSDGTPFLMDVTEMVQSALTAADDARRHRRDGGC